MKRFILWCILVFIIMGCSPGNPNLSEANISSNESNVYTGQRVLVQVNAVTDNPPFTYEWTTTGGELAVDGSLLYANLWTAPETPGTYTITCKIIDNEDKQVTKTWTVNVIGRELKVAISSGVLTITKQIDSNIGGIWASVQDNYIRFLSSQTDLTSSSDGNTTWKRNLITMIARVDPNTLDYKAIGVEATPVKTIHELEGTAEGTLECPNCTGINSLAQDILDTTILWVADDSGLYSYFSTDKAWYTQPLTGIFYDLYEGSNNVYAAASTGIYTIPDDTKLYDNDTRAVCVVGNTNTSGTITSYTIWAVSNGTVIKINLDENGLNPVVVPVPQPAEVIDSIDVDARGYIWCGRYWWDGTSWTVIPDATLNGLTIVKSVASGEGLIYLLTDSGVLYRW